MLLQRNTHWFKIISKKWYLKTPNVMKLPVKKWKYFWLLTSTTILRRGPPTVLLNLLPPIKSSISTRLAAKTLSKSKKPKKIFKHWNKLWTNPASTNSSGNKWHRMRSKWKLFTLGLSKINCLMLDCSKPTIQFTTFQHIWTKTKIVLFSSKTFQTLSIINMIHSTKPKYWKNHHQF